MRQQKLQDLWMRTARVLAILLPFLALNFSGAAKGAERILFIPHDNRPISMQQSAEVAEAAGYSIHMPPEEFLSRGVNEPGHPEELWKWLEENARLARAAVLSTDSLLYGGLIASRKHELSQEVLQERLSKFQKFHAKHPGLAIYLFGSLMRTPKSGEYAGSEEPDYYIPYGKDIFEYTALADKEEMGYLTSGERKKMKEARERIPTEVFDDWMNRRAKNLAATKELAELTAKGVARSFIIGKDDNAPLCQTHKENRELHAFAKEKGIPQEKVFSLTGIDEFNLLLLTRAVNDLKGEIPFVHVRYNEGMGGETIPSFSDETIEKSIRDAVLVAGGMMVPTPARADFVLLVNTDPKGRTGEASESTPGATPLVNDGKERRGTKHFFRMVEDSMEKGYPVGIADIAFANGSDNALMKNLEQKGILPKLRAYAGWNTATNSAGFALGTGMLAPHMTEEGRKRLLTRRFLDDWAYQANVRTEISRQLGEEGRWEAYIRLDKHRPEMEERTAKRLRQFAQERFPSQWNLNHLKVSFPWNRMFECGLDF